jgi:7-cyano-7-deazaguanine synthase
MKSVVHVISGGLDSTIVLRMLIEERYDPIYCISFDYGQKQRHELKLAEASCKRLNVPHEIIDIKFLSKIAEGMSANVDTNIQMPTIKEVLGDPQPKTYVPNRNMILMAIAAAYAEKKNCNYVSMGLQLHDEYSYHDTTQQFVDCINNALCQNRKHKIEIIAPFCNLSKTDELRKLLEVDGNLDLAKTTMTCYNPNINNESCGVCPSCAERIQAFRNIGVEDPISYSININWKGK